MQTFTGFEYLLIDVANNWGLDKKAFSERIQWVKDNMDCLELLAVSRDKWKEMPLYLKAISALRKVQRDEPTGHMVGFDAVNSGMQIMSATTGCHAGAEATGMVNPNERADAYELCTDIMRRHIPTLPAEARENVKQAVMTSLYGSHKVPEDLFGEDTPELKAFYAAMWEMAPGACELLHDLMVTWQPDTLKHSWVMPDNFHVHVKVMVTVDDRLEIDELDHSTLSYRYQINAPRESGLSNAANVIHSIDAYVLRSMVRRTNYDENKLYLALYCVGLELMERDHDTSPSTRVIEKAYSSEVRTLVDRYKATKMADVRVMEYLQHRYMHYFDTEHLISLSVILHNMAQHDPFEIITIHDQFSTHPNNVNWVRFHYKEILAELAESTILTDIFSAINGEPTTYHKLSEDLGDKIRNSNYALS